MLKFCVYNNPFVYRWLFLDQMMDCLMAMPRKLETIIHEAPATTSCIVLQLVHRGRIPGNEAIW
jgi:hypothetical protein